MRKGKDKEYVDPSFFPSFFRGALHCRYMRGAISAQNL
jgi:hypothetical protein